MLIGIIIYAIVITANCIWLAYTLDKTVKDFEKFKKDAIPF